MKVIVGRIYRYLDRQPDNDRYGRERHSVSEPSTVGMKQAGSDGITAELTSHANFWQERQNPAAQATGFSSWE